MKITGIYTDWAAQRNTGAIGYYRIRMPGKACGWRVVGDVPISKRLHPDDMFDYMIGDADVVISCPMDNPVTWKRIVHRMSQMEKRPAYILNVDDNYKEVHPQNPSFSAFQEGTPSMAMMRHQLALADCIAVTRANLMSAYQEDNSSFAVCPNYIDPWMAPIDPFDKKGTKRRHKDEIRIGWAGGFSHEPDFAEVFESIKALGMKFKNIVFVAMGYEPQILKMNLPQHQWQWGGCATPHYNYLWLLHKMDIDIAIAPLAANAFNQGKSAIKVLEYGQCGIATIASKGWGLPYQEVIKNGKNGFLCATKDEWLEALTELCQNAEKRREFGWSLRDHVQTNFDISKHTNKWDDAVKTAIKVRDSRSDAVAKRQERLKPLRVVQ